MIKFLKKLSIEKVLTILFITITILFTSSISLSNKKIDTPDYSELTATILEVTPEYLTVKDENNIIYTFQNPENLVNMEIGENIILQYTGLLNKNSQNQNITIIECIGNYQEVNFLKEQSSTDLFSKYYNLAYKKLQTLTLDEKIGQIFLVRVPKTDQIEAIKRYSFGGYVLFKRDFEDKTKSEVINMIKDYQDASKIPLLIAADEEGGTVTRISSNTALVAEPFKSPQELYAQGGFKLIKTDTIAKSEILQELGINLNLAPVVDVSENPNDYIYKRTLGQNTAITSTFAKTVIEASQVGNVSYTLKHFPGYGNNLDTHTGTSTDTRSFEDIMSNDIPPFQAGIEAGAEAVLVSHNTVTSIDPSNPASLSASVHNLLRNELKFSGVIITDDLAMAALDNLSDSAVIKAIQAGNDLLIVTDYENSIQQVKNAINDGTLTESLLDPLVFRILAWKYYKGLIVENQK